MKLHQLVKRSEDGNCEDPYEGWGLSDNQWSKIREQCIRCHIGSQYPKTGAQEPAGSQSCSWDFDLFVCWPPAGFGETVLSHCPDLPITVPKQNAVSRTCLGNNTWSKPDYVQCFLDPEELPVDESEAKVENYVWLVHYIGCCLSIGSLLIALGILTSFRPLRSLRNIIHCNFMGALLLNSIAWLAIFITMNSDPEFRNDYPTLCFIIMVIYKYIYSVVYYWMFVECLYLFMIIIWAYSAIRIKLWYYLIIGWVLPILPTAIWVGAKVYVINTDPTIEHAGCLITKDMLSIDYIRNAPILLMLSANCFFITAVVWVLWTKLRADTSFDTAPYKKAAKATAILYPLFGANYLLFYEFKAYGSLQLVFVYINAFFRSFLGFFAALVYCFLNGEVQTVLRQKLRAFQETRSVHRSHVTPTDTELTRTGTVAATSGGSGDPGLSGVDPGEKGVVSADDEAAARGEIGGVEK